MAVEVADLVARLRADVREFQTKLDQAAKSVTNLEKPLAKAQSTAGAFGAKLSQLPGPLGQVAGRVSGFTALLTGPAGLALGLGAAVSGLILLVRHAITVGEELKRLSTITGQSVETLSALRLAAETNETSLQEVAQAMGFLQRAMVEAGTGNEELLRLFQALGVAVRDLHGNFRPTEAVMEEVAKAMQRLSSDAERTRVVMALLGRGGREIMPFLDDLAKRGFAGVREEAQRLNLVLSTDAANAADALGDKFTTLRLRLSSFGVAIGNQLIPALNDLLTILQHPRWELFAAMGAALTGNWQGALTIFRELQKELRQMESMDIFRQQRAGERGLMPPSIRLPDEAALKRAKELTEALLKIEIDRWTQETKMWEGLDDLIAAPYLEAIKFTKQLEAIEIERWAKEVEMWSGYDDLIAAPLLKARELQMNVIENTAALIEDLVRVEGTRLEILGKMNAELKTADVLAGLLGKDFDRLGTQIQIVDLALKAAVEAWVQAWVTGNTEVRDSLGRLIQDLSTQLAGLKTAKIPIDEWKALVATVLGAINQMVIGVLQGTQTIEEAFERLVQNIILAMMSEQLTKALKPVLENFGAEMTKFMDELGKESGNAFGTAFGQSLALIGASVVASGIGQINQDEGANKKYGQTGAAIGAVIGGAIAAYFTMGAGTQIGMIIGSAIGGAIGRGINKEIASIGPEMQTRLNDIFAPWFAQFQDDIRVLGEAVGRDFLTGVQKGAEAIGLRSFVRELGFEKMHIKDFDRLLKPILEATATAVSQGFKAGMAAPSAAEGFAIFKQSIYKSVIDGLVVALSQGVIFQKALAPIVAMLQTQTTEGLVKGFADALNFLMEQLVLLEPVFEELFTFIQDMATLLDVTIDTPEMPSIETNVADLTNEIDQFLKDLGRLTAELQGLDAQVANLNADLALTQAQIDRVRVELEMATDPSAILDLSQQLMDLTIDYYETSIDLATALHDEIVRLESVLSQAITDVTQLTLSFTGTSQQSLELAMGLADAIDAFDSVTVAAQLFASVMEALGQAFIQAATSGTGADITASIEAIVAAVSAMSQVVTTIMTEVTDPESQLALLTMLASSLERLYQDTLAGIRAAFDRMREMETEASQARIEALQEERDAITETLDAQREAAQETLQVVQEWARVAETLRKYLLDLQLGQFAPPNPMAAFGVAQSEFDAAVAAFRAGGTPETAQAIQEMAQRLLQEASEVFARPSPEYSALFTSITAILDEVNAVAQLQAATEEDLLAEIKGLDELRNTQLQAIDDAIKAEQEALDATLKRLGEEQAQLEADAQEFFASQFSYLQSAMVDSIIALELQLEEQQAALEAVIGEDNTYEQFIAEMTVKEVDALQQIDADLKALLSALGISYEHGTDYVPKTGPYLLHEGEQVVPAGETPAGGSIYIAPGAIVISGVSDPERAADLVLEKLYRSLRSGKGRKLVEAIK